MSSTYPYFGGCPHCGQTDGYLNVHKEVWFRCDRHHTKWCAGSGLFSSWMDETEADWNRNAALLAGYVELKPRHLAAV